MSTEWRWRILKSFNIKPIRVYVLLLLCSLYFLQFIASLTVYMKGNAPSLPVATTILVHGKQRRPNRGSRVSSYTATVPSMFGALEQCSTIFCQCDVDDYIHVKFTRHFLSPEGVRCRISHLKFQKTFPAIIPRSQTWDPLLYAWETLNDALQCTTTCAIFGFKNPKFFSGRGKAPSSDLAPVRRGIHYSHTSAHLLPQLKATSNAPDGEWHRGDNLA